MISKKTAELARVRMDWMGKDCLDFFPDDIYLTLKRKYVSVKNFLSLSRVEVNSECRQSLLNNDINNKENSYRNLKFFWAYGAVLSLWWGCWLDMEMEVIVPFCPFIGCSLVSCILCKCTISVSSHHITGGRMAVRLCTKRLNELHNPYRPSP